MVGIQGRDVVTWWSAKRLSEANPTLVELAYLGFDNVVGEHEPVRLYFTPEEWEEVRALVDEAFEGGHDA